MRVLVTGATGFTGGALARRLLQEGAQVTTFVRSMQRAEPLRQLGVECKAVDITNREEVLREFQPFDRVYHIAALFRTEESDLSAFTRVNVEATRNLLEAAKQVGVGRFVHCSTVGVQGRIDDPPASETYRFHPEDHYQQTKLEGEQAAREYFAAGLPGAVVRPAGIYGPGDTRFLKLFKGIQRGWFVLIGTGQTLYHFTYIDDLIDGFLLAGNHPRANGEVFTIGGAHHVTIREVVDTIADVLGKPHPRLRIPAWPVEMAAHLCVGVCKPFGINPPLYPRRLEFFTMSRSFSITKARELLGYDPKIDLREGLTRTAAWYRQQRLI
ncbi:MAG: NAD-dependent epimerase/dehydratase family protein [Steroidobacteraceae bacterium]